jgi:transcriptional/translational regulatory protein YebC/TACO1
MPGSTDPNVNSKLADALAKAKEGGATKAHIESTFARVSTDHDSR